MKSIFKIMMALAVICLPFALVSCGDDDDDGPHTDTYTWVLDNTTPPSSATSEAKIAAAQAEQAIDEALYLKFNSKGWNANKAERKFVITGGTSLTNDQLVKIEFNIVLSGLSSAVRSALPNDAKVSIKRGGTTVDSSKLN